MVTNWINFYGIDFNVTPKGATLKRVTKEHLISLLTIYDTDKEVGNHLNVSSVSIVRWRKYYNIPSNRSK